MTVWTLHFDGANEPFNPKGIATYGYVLKRERILVRSSHGLATEPGSERSTNNLAEYAGLYKGLLAVKEFTANGDTISVFGDSQLIINQMKGEWAIKAENLARPSAATIQILSELERGGRKITLTWIRREENTEADHESKIAIREALKKPEVLKKVTIPTSFGKHAGKTLFDVPPSELSWYFKRALC